MELFDSLIHKADFQVESIVENMNANGIKFACITDFIDIKKISHREYYTFFSLYNQLIPVAYVDINLSNIEKIVKNIHKIGYKAIKIHVRQSNSSLLNKNIKIIFDLCAQFNIIVYLCTYFYDNSQNMLKNTFDNLMKVIMYNSSTKIVLIHGGTTSVLQYMEVVRTNHNLLLDLSFTLCKYEGSSLDLDIRFLFKNFDRRICIGSDFPDFSFKKLRERYTFFSKGIDIEKQKNIAYRNLANFLGVEY